MIPLAVLYTCNSIFLRVKNEATAKKKSGQGTGGIRASSRIRERKGEGSFSLPDPGLRQPTFSIVPTDREPEQATLELVGYEMIIMIITSGLVGYRCMYHPIVIARSWNNC